MVRTVLIYLLWAIIIALIIIWLFGGGIGKIKTTAASIGNPLTYLESGPSFVLPWQLPAPKGVDISNLVGSGNAGTSPTGNDSGESQATTFGSPSSQEGTVSIDTTGASGSDVQSEYLEIENNGSSALDITGWSLQSAISGARAYIPRGASFFLMGAVNMQNDITLLPGATAIITTGFSPVGTAFEENECSGYLGQLQTYIPALQSECPAPSDLDNEAQQYGQNCADFVDSLSSCEFPNALPSDLSSECQQFIQTNFSYNGCAQAHENDASFASNSWRIYLDASRELWNNNHDTIRLLDGQGRIVAVTSY